MTRILLLVLLTFCLAPAVHAQNEAGDLLNRAAQRFRQAGGIEANFSVKSPDGILQGRIRLQGEKFVLEADGMTTWFDGRTQWSYLRSTDEVNISQPTAEELQSINPYALLSLYREGYALSLGSDSRLQGRAVRVVTLTATDTRRDWNRIVLWIDSVTLQPLRIDTTPTGAVQSSTISIDSYRTGQDYADSLFTFPAKDYPTAEVIDLR